MQSQQCLFFNESAICNNYFKKEHIIQKGLGGTLSSPEIICSNCNNYFSQELDVSIEKIYAPIIKILSPFISGKLKYKKYKTKLVSGKAGQDGIDIEYTGGVANLEKIKPVINPKGQLEEIIGPSSVPKDKIENIARRKGAQNISFETRLITEAYPDAIDASYFDVNSSLIRAILCDILELAYYGYIKKIFPNIAMHHCLSNLRLWVRTGRATTRILTKDICSELAPISDLLDQIFEPSTFSHRLGISYDCKSKALILFAQFANTMPCVFTFEDIPVHSHSVSILYKKALLDGTNQLFTLDYGTLNIHDIKLRTFSAATKESREFAKAKWLQEIHTQRERVHYEYDLRIDDFIKQRLVYYIKELLNKTKTPEIDAIVRRIQEQYQESQHLKDILDITKKKALEIWAHPCFANNQRDQKLLCVYRECLKYIKNKYGYPAIAVDMKNYQP
ncbi:MAG: HNH endonuclease [Sedimentisphaerales bacterium]